MQEVVENIALEKLKPFPNHPFKIREDEAMMETVESVKTFGVLQPAIVRHTKDGEYEILSGHRRKRACELTGRKTMPVIVRKLDDDAAVIFMMDSNLQRENILPSERAAVYKMKLDAMKRQGMRTDLTSVQVEKKLRLMTADIYFETVRTLFMNGGQWFGANDVFRVLGIANTKDALRTLDDDEKYGIDIIDPHSRNLETNCINGLGLCAGFHPVGNLLQIYASRYTNRNKHILTDKSRIREASIMTTGRSTACLTAFSEPTKRRPLRLLPINSPTSLFSFAHPDKIYPDKKVKYGAVSYIVPKNCIVIYPPHTDERKAAARKRAKITGFQTRNDR